MIKKVLDMQKKRKLFGAVDVTVTIADSKATQGRSQTEKTIKGCLGANHNDGILMVMPKQQLT